MNMLISRFYCGRFLFDAKPHCDVQCDTCKPEEKPMVQNEEKEPLWFVWEKTTRGGLGVHYQPSLYRGLPQTGTGKQRDDERFVFKKKIEGADIGKEFVTLINENPCPVKPV